MIFLLHPVVKKEKEIMKLRRVVLDEGPLNMSLEEFFRRHRERMNENPEETLRERKRRTENAAREQRAKRNSELIADIRVKTFQNLYELTRQCRDVPDLVKPLQLDVFRERLPTEIVILIVKFLEDKEDIALLISNYINDVSSKTLSEDMLSMLDCMGLLKDFEIYKSENNRTAENDVSNCCDYWKDNMMTANIGVFRRNGTNQKFIDSMMYGGTKRDMYKLRSAAPYVFKNAKFATTVLTRFYFLDVNDCSTIFQLFKDAFEELSIVKTVITGFQNLDANQDAVAGLMYHSLPDSILSSESVMFELCQLLPWLYLYSNEPSVLLSMRILKSVVTDLGDELYQLVHAIRPEIQGNDMDIMLYLIELLEDVDIFVDAGTISMDLLRNITFETRLKRILPDINVQQLQYNMQI